MVSPRATATAVYTQSLGELVPSLHGFRDFILFGPKPTSTGKEVESSHHIVEPVQYPPQPECDDGIPKTCYCGGEPVVAAAHTSKDIGRRYFTCENADDGECHIWKWWDVAVTEELRDYQRQLREVKDPANDIDEKLVKLEKSVGGWAEEKDNVLTSSLEELQRMKKPNV
uniref:GRF-type domain-containing protein n=1 Tax=Brassica oleracea var. oleracea TaxID=109376 RepID=A0A0D3EFH7_BRAOL